MNTKDLKVRTKDKMPIEFIIPNAFTWNGDLTISIFLRDWLRAYNELNNGVPQEYIDMANGDVELGAKYFEEDIAALADTFDYIVNNAFDDKVDIQFYINSAFERLARLYLKLNW